ncbi:High mobility group B protein 1 [Raphanus sativus]|uniref:High mobility group B protein 1 n=1 Tax=Raphanus sativus TaxID=3726 RepID=A0A6J0JCP2_RAPSA|nr:high mobility group B protein 1 [Raphanus sativus]KAJ4890134.1 High mobility group B protein 1 [Raphanus sativus]
MKTAKGKGKAKTTKEALKPVDDRKVGKRKAPAEKPSKRETRKEKKAKKDPNKPKRAPSAFFVFLEDFRQTFKKENPDVKAVSAVGKAGGQKWKSMSQAEKAPYEEKAAKRKAEYEKLMDAYNKSMEEGSDESENSLSEVNDEDEASEEEEKVEKGKAGEDDEDDDDDDEDDEDDEED